MAKKLIKTYLFVLLGPVFLAGAAAGQQKFQPTVSSFRQATVSGNVKEFLSAMEAQAMEAEKNAVSSWFPQQYWAGAVQAYALAANAALSTGQLQKAIDYGQKALAIAEKTKDSASLFRAIDTLVPIYGQVRNFDQARELIGKGMAVVKDLPPNVDPRAYWEGNLYAKLGRDLMRRREYEKAIDALSLSVNLQQSYLATVRRNPVWLNVHRGDLLYRLTRLGNAYRFAGRLPDASEQYQRAFDYIREWGIKWPGETDLYEGMGEIHFQQKDFPQALENFQKVLALAERRDMAGAVTWASRRIGDILLQTGNQSDAVPYYQKAIRHVESTRSLLESEEHRQSYFEGAVRTYTSAIVALMSAGKWQEAFNYSERARSRAFLDVLGTRVQLSKAKSGLLERERGLQERIAAIKARLSGEEEEETNRTGLRKELRDVEQAYNTFLAKVRKEDKEQTSLMTVEPLTLTQVQELLDPETTLIEYFVAERNVIVWIVERERMRSLRLMPQLPRHDLTGLVKSLRENIFNYLGDKEKLTAVSTSLHQHLIEPLLPHIRGKELIIVPHDVLHYLPFHALAGADGKYLIEKYPIYYLSTASLLQFTREKRQAMGDKVLALGNPDLGDPEKNLEYAEFEVRQVKAVYPKSSVWLKKDATEEKSKSLSPTHDILHFATHAQLNEDDPLSSAVLLAKEDKEDGRLEVREIFGMDLKANLVVLSGCDTGLGKLSTGDELVGLTRAFIYAGSPSVIATLWKVNDSSTAQLMASFYRNLTTMSKVEALRQAQLQFIHGQGRSELLARRGVGGIAKLGETPEPQLQSPVESSTAISSSHPYFWAPFILMGDGR